MKRQNFEEYVSVCDPDGEIHRLSREGWKSKSAWKRHFRKVLPDAEPWIYINAGTKVYSLDQTVETTPTARQIAYREFETIYRFQSCDPDKWIYARLTDQGEERKTEYAASGWHDAYFQRFPGSWAVSQHLSGKKMLGVCAGEKTRVAFFDLDNHGQEHDPDWHLERVMTLATDLASRYPKMKLSAEVNPKNASTKLQITFPRAFRVETEIRPWLEEYINDLHARFPRLRYDRLELFPLNLPQVLVPLRPDKIAVTDGFLEKIPHYCLDLSKRRVPIEIYSVEDFVQYLNNESRHLNLPILRSQVIQSLDWDRVQVRTVVQRTKQPGTEGELRFKDKFLSHITDFVEGNIAPDTIGKYVTPIERYLMVAEGLGSAETHRLIEKVVNRHPDVAYSDRLSRRPREFWRSDALTRKAIAKGDGYQADPDQSTAKLRAVKKRWDARGIDVVAYLDTGNQMHIRPENATPRMKVKWDGHSARLAAELAALAHCALEKSREILETVAGHVRNGGEMAIEYLRGMLLRLGLKCRHHNKAADIRQWLERTGMIIKVRNYWFMDGKGMGTYYGLGLIVQEQAEEADTPASILPSIPSRPQHPNWIIQARRDYRRLTMEKQFLRRWKQAACA